MPIPLRTTHERAENLNSFSLLSAGRQFSASHTSGPDAASEAAGPDITKLPDFTRSKK
jgi:hypothetical protein